MTDLHISCVTLLLRKTFEGQFRIYNKCVDGLLYFWKTVLVKNKIQKRRNQNGREWCFKLMSVRYGTYLKLIVEWRNEAVLGIWCKGSLCPFLEISHNLQIVIRYRKYDKGQIQRQFAFIFSTFGRNPPKKDDAIFFTPCPLQFSKATK